VIGCGDEDIGGSLVVEDIGKTDQKIYSDRVKAMRKIISSKRNTTHRKIQIIPFCIIPKVEVGTGLGEGEGDVQRIAELGKTFDKLKTTKGSSWASFHAARLCWS
jgi:hypothetical protein